VLGALERSSERGISAVAVSAGRLAGTLGRCSGPEKTPPATGGDPLGATIARDATDGDVWRAGPFGPAGAAAGGNGSSLDDDTTLDEEAAGDTTAGESPLDNGLIGPAMPAPDVPATAGPAAAVLASAAGIVVEDEREAGAGAVRATAGLGNSGGDSTWIKPVMPTKPLTTAAMPQTTRVLSDMPRLDAGE
jgi:hypothetical protein